MYDYLRFKNNIKKNGSKNFTFVKVRSPHNCSHCLKIVETGTECLTVNPRRNSRRWYCEDCAELMFNVQQAKSALNSVDFDDEGAAYAYMDWLEEAEAELEEAKGVGSISSYSKMLRFMLNLLIKTFGKENVRNGWSNERFVVTEKATGKKYSIVVNEIED